MTSLYKRATPSQARVLRIIEGAVKNTTDAHPGLEIRPHHRRSIAKRAAGTLTAQWPEVLAATGPSGSGEAVTLTPPRRRSSDRTKAIGREAHMGTTRFPLRQLVSEISRQITPLKAAGDTVRADTLVVVLRIIHRLRGL